MTTVALIPTFKPNGNLFDVLEGLRREGIERVVVDDGSGLEYRSMFRRATQDSVVLSYGVNHGKGYALKLGLRYIQEHYPQDTVVVTVDADGQHKVDDTIRCAREASRNPTRLYWVVGRSTTREFPCEAGSVTKLPAWCTALPRARG